MSSWPWRRQFPNCGALQVLLLAVAGCSGGSEPSVPAEITLSSTEVTLAAAGQTIQLTATVLDQDGDPIPITEVALNWESGNTAIVTVGVLPSGVGQLVAQSPGTAEVTVTAGEVSASATVIVQSTASLELLEGNGQSAPAGSAVPTAPSVVVRDASSNPVAGVQVRFQVGAASGTVTGETQTTGADGIARVGSWRLGSSGVNTLTATVEGAQIEGEPVEFVATTAAENYDITIRYLTEISNAQLLAFAEAEVRWESLIISDLPDVNDNLPSNSCGQNPAVAGPFDDLLIFVTIEPIDGEFGVLGQAGPCFVRDPGNLSVIGRMRFDEADMDLLEADGSLQSVILHEMGHVLGFGTLWTTFGFLADSADPNTPAIEDPHFTGPQALAAFDAAGGGPYAGAKVPVMDVGGAGTRNSHWRDEVFDPELMTGFLSEGFNPLSAISVRSLEDLGYDVSVVDADPFTIDLTPIRTAGARRGRQLVNDILRDPIRKIDVNGRITGVIRR